MRNVACPRSANVVGQGFASEQGAGDLSTTCTSECSRLPNVVLAPEAAVSKSRARNTGERLSRTTSPHEMLPATSGSIDPELFTPFVFSAESRNFYEGRLTADQLEESEAFIYPLICLYSMSTSRAADETPMVCPYSSGSTIM